jgi:hypothetical protein
MGTAKSKHLFPHYLYAENGLRNQRGLNKNVKIPIQNRIPLSYLVCFVENQYCVEPKYVINFKTEVIFHCGIGISVGSIADSRDRFPL